MGKIMGKMMGQLLWENMGKCKGNAGNMFGTMMENYGTFPHEMDVLFLWFLLGQVVLVLY